MPNSISCSNLLEKSSMSYSTDADLILVLPNSDDYATDSEGDSATGVYSDHREWATAFIDNRLRGKTATPVTNTETTVIEQLSYVEANLVAFSLVRGNFTKFDAEGADQAFLHFKKEAVETLDDLYFPASYSTPVQVTGFVGDGTITVSVVDQFSYTGDVIVKCIIGGSSPLFEVADMRTGIKWSYDVANDGQFPSNSHLQLSSAESLIKHLTVSISLGGTEYAQGDTWLFRLFSNYKKNRKDTNIRLWDRL